MKITREQPVDLAIPARLAETELPDGWAMVRLAEVVQEVPNVNPDGERHREFGYVDISSICNETHRILNHKRFKGKDAPSRARRPISPGDVLFSNVRTYLRNVAIVPTSLEVQLCSTGFTVLRSNGAINPQFLFRYVLTDDFIDRVTPQQTGTHYPATSDRVVMGESLPLPPLAEQQRIVAKIEALLARVNAARQRLVKVPAILKRFRQSVLAAACCGRLTADWREEQPDVEPASVLLQTIRRDRRRKTAYEDNNAFEPRMPLPAKWIWTRLGDCFEVCAGGTPSRKESIYWGGEIPWVSSGEVQFCRIRRTRERITQAGLENSNTKLNPPGTVLLGMIGEGRTRGQAAILDVAACNNQNAAAIRVAQTSVPPEYIYYWLWSQYEITRGRGAGNSQPALNKERVERINLPLPPLPEQHEIVRRVEALFRLADAIEQQVTVATARTERLTQAILARAFRAELVPTEAELARRETRDYERAPVLLERIRAERDQSNDRPRGITGKRNPRRSRRRKGHPQ